MEPANGMVEGEELALSHKEAQKAQIDFLIFCAFCASLWLHVYLGTSLA